MTHELRDISEFGGVPDLAHLQRKISAAGDMKKAIRDLLEAYETGVPPNIWLRRINSLRKSMEKYSNV